MRHFFPIVLIGFVASVVHAADVFSPDWWNSYYSMSFTGYQAGDALSDDGARGGSWGEEPVPEGFSAKVKVVDGEKVLDIDVDNWDDAWLKFTPRARGLTSTRAGMFRAKFTSLESLPALADTAIGGFTVAATNSEDVAFMIYDPAARQWLAATPESGAITPAFDVWYDFAFRFKKIGGVECLSYYLKATSGDYVLLKADDTAESRYFPVPSVSDPRQFRVRINGLGQLGDFNGVCQKGGALTIR